MADKDPKATKPVKSGNGKYERKARPGSPSRDLLVSEFASEYQGAPPPFGDLPSLPMPLSEIRYEHPSEEDRPTLVPHA